MVKYNNSGTEFQSQKLYDSSEVVITNGIGLIKVFNSDISAAVK